MSLSEANPVPVHQVVHRALPWRLPRPGTFLETPSDEHDGEHQRRKPQRRGPLHAERQHGKEYHDGCDNQHDEARHADASLANGLEVFGHVCDPTDAQTGFPAPISRNRLSARR